MKFCWFYRKTVSWAADSGAQLPYWAERHLLACAQCRRFQQDESRLANALAGAAGAQRTEFPPFLHSRIVFRLATERPKATGRVPGFHWLRAALIPAFGVLVIAAYLGWKPHRHDALPPQGVSSVAEANPSIPPSDPDRLLAWTGKLDWPLANELDSVVSDAKSAMRSIGENFLPSQFLAQSEP